MKPNVIVLGGIILAVGLILVFVGLSIMGEYETFFGRLARLFSGEAEQEYRSAILVTLGGIVFSVVGFISVVVGSVTQK